MTSPTLANGMVFIRAYAYIYALDANTGALVWRSYNTGSGSPTVANGVLYAGSMDTNLYALNASTGAPIWQ